MYLAHLKGASGKANSYQATFAVPVTAVLTAIMKKSSLSVSSNVGLSFSCGI